MSQEKRKRKKKTRRSKVKNAALDPRYSPKIRRELLDMDYIDQLSEEDKAWLNKFTEEYVEANLDFKNLENNLHNTPELKKDCTDRNNARNRCIYGIAKASNRVMDDPRSENDTSLNNPELSEEALIAFIDKKYKED